MRANIQCEQFTHRVENRVITLVEDLVLMVHRIKTRLNIHGDFKDLLRNIINHNKYIEVVTIEMRFSLTNNLDLDLVFPNECNEAKFERKSICIYNGKNLFVVTFT